MSQSGQYQTIFDFDYIYYSLDYGQTWTQSNSGTNNWGPISISGNGQYALSSLNNSGNGHLYRCTATN